MQRPLPMCLWLASWQVLSAGRPWPKIRRFPSSHRENRRPHGPRRPGSAILSLATPFAART